MGDQTSFDSDSIDHCLIHGEESSLFKGTHETYPCDRGDPLDGYDCSNVVDHKSTLVNNFEERDELDESRSNISAENSLTSTFENCLVPSSHQKELLLWVDDYKCSICGIEMPPDFVEERQEHFDFHLAKKLQDEESSIDLRTSMPRQRNVNKDQSSSRKKHKRQKSSPKESKHIPIDMFFLKTSQNF